MVYPNTQCCSSLSIWITVSLCLSLLPFLSSSPLFLPPCPLSSRLKSDRLCFSAGVWTQSDQCRTKGKSGGEVAGRGNTIGYWQWIQSLKDWRRQLSKRRALGVTTMNVIHGLTSLWDVLTLIVPIDCVYLHAYVLAVMVNLVCLRCGPLRGRRPKSECVYAWARVQRLKCHTHHPWKKKKKKKGEG